LKKESKTEETQRGSEEGNKETTGNLSSPQASLRVPMGRATAIKLAIARLTPCLTEEELDWFGIGKM
jgi:hypothetical protein